MFWRLISKCVCIYADIGARWMSNVTSRFWESAIVTEVKWFKLCRLNNNVIAMWWVLREQRSTGKLIFMVLFYILISNTFTWAVRTRASVWRWDNCVASFLCIASVHLRIFWVGDRNFFWMAEHRSWLWVVLSTLRKFIQKITCN